MTRRPVTVNPLVERVSAVLGHPAIFSNARCDSDAILAIGVPQSDRPFWIEAARAVCGTGIELVFLDRARRGISMAAARGCGTLYSESLACGCAALQIDGDDAWHLRRSYACTLAEHVPLHLHGGAARTGDIRPPR